MVGLGCSLNGNRDFDPWPFWNCPEPVHGLATIVIRHILDPTKGTCCANVCKNPRIPAKSRRLSTSCISLRATIKNAGAFNYPFLPESHVQLRPWHWSLSRSWAEKPSECVQFTKDKRRAFPQANVPLISVLFQQISILFQPISVHVPPISVHFRFLHFG